MKDSFPGYYPLANDQMKAFLSEAIIVNRGKSSKDGPGCFEKW